MRRAIKVVRKKQKHIEMADLAGKKELVVFQWRKRLHRETRNGAWLSAVLHRLNITELYQEEFRENLCVRYGLMPQDIPETCDGCGKRFSVEQALSCPKSGFDLAWHDGDCSTENLLPQPSQVSGIS